MFSANENIALRQHKRRIIQYVEHTIEDSVLDMGTTVMVMQVSCKAPGCVPLETVICIVFPKLGEKELIAGLHESANGGTYKTKVLMPMADISKDDVLDSLPPQFKGGRRSVEKLCLQARDVMLAQITQLMGEEPTNLQGRQLMAEYLQSCLKEYMSRDCVAPQYGETFPDVVIADEKEPTDVLASGSGNLVIKRVLDDDATTSLPGMTSTEASNSTQPTTAAAVTTATKKIDYRGQQKMENMMKSQDLLQQLAKREHAPGVRVAGCPCCDPDNPANYVDSMMML